MKNRVVLLLSALTFIWSAGEALAWPIQTCSSWRMQDEPIAKLAGFFVNSVRRNMTPIEERGIFRLFDRVQETAHRLNGCAAFFVSNDSNTEEVFLGSHRHCFQFAPEEACVRGEIFAQHLQSGATVSCSRIVIIDEEHDFFIFAARPQNDTDRLALEQGHKLKLSACEPPADLPLVMLGFPGDRRRRGQPTASDSCSVRAKISGTHQPRNIHERELEKSLRDEDRKQPPEFQARAKKVDDHMEVSSLRHDCTTWTGNSGGPILGKRSGDVVVGLPVEAILVERPIDPSIGLRMENMAEFVRRNHKILEKEGVTISHEYCELGQNL